MARKTPLPKNLIYVDIKVKKEEWNAYRLTKNNALLKTKYVLISVLLEKDFEKKLVATNENKGKRSSLGFAVNSTNVIGVEVPASQRGEPSEATYTLDEFRASIVDDDIDYEVVSEKWNEYLIANGVIVMKVKSSPINISLTDKFDVQGIPIYLVDFTADIKIKAKKGKGIQSPRPVPLDST